MMPAVVVKSEPKVVDQRTGQNFLLWKRRPEAVCGRSRPGPPYHTRAEVPRPGRTARATGPDSADGIFRSYRKNNNTRMDHSNDGTLGRSRSRDGGRTYLLKRELL